MCLGDSVFASPTIYWVTPYTSLWQRNTEGSLVYFVHHCSMWLPIFLSKVKVGIRNCCLPGCLYHPPARPHLDPITAYWPIGAGHRTSVFIWVVQLWSSELSSWCPGLREYAGTDSMSQLLSLVIPPGNIDTLVAFSRVGNSRWTCSYNMGTLHRVASQGPGTLRQRGLRASLNVKISTYLTATIFSHWMPYPIHQPDSPGIQTKAFFFKLYFFLNLTY